MKLINKVLKTAQKKLLEQRGDSSLDTVMHWVIAIVIGGLILGGLYILFGDTVMPWLETKVMELFNFNG